MAPGHTAPLGGAGWIVRVALCHARVALALLVVASERAPAQDPEPAKQDAPATGSAPAQSEPASQPASRPARRRPQRPASAATGVPIAIVGARVLRPGMPPLEDATILVRGQKIAAIGTKIEIPQNARRIDAKGTTITAGWIDARGSTPLEPAAILDAGQQVPGNRAIDGLDLVDREGRVREALRRGVTSCYVAPGRGLMAGQGALVKMRPNETDLDKLEVEDTEALEIVGGSSRGTGAVSRLAEWTIVRRTLRETQKYREALDAYHEELDKFLEEKKKGAKTAPRPAGVAEEKTEEPPGGGGPTPVPRRRRPPRNQDEADLLAALQVLRIFPIVNDPDGAVLLDADATGVETIDDDDGCGHLHPPGADGPLYFFEDVPQTKPGDSKAVERPKKPPLNPTWDAMLPGLTREVPVRFEARRADEIRAAIAVAKEFRLRGVIDGADEADLVLDEIAESKMPVVITPARSAEWPRDGRERSATLAAALAERGIPFAIGTGRDVNGTRWLRAQVALAIAGGASREEALAAVTTRAADILGVGDRLGSLEPGHEADLVIFEGDPFDPTTEVRAALVDGEVLFER